MSLLYFNFIRPGEAPADRALAYQAALDMAGYKAGDPRAPLAAATAEAREQIRAELARVAEVV